MYQTNEEATSHIHKLVCLCSLDLFTETCFELFGSSLGTWSSGHGPDVRLATRDLNVLPDPFCFAAACDTTHIPICKQNHVQIHRYEVVNFSYNFNAKDYGQGYSLLG